MNNSNNIKMYTCAFNNDDFIFCKDEQTGNIISAGYSIDSLLMRDDIAPIQTFNINNGLNNDSNNQFADMYKNLAVPAGLCYVNYPNISNKSNINMNMNSKNENEYKFSEPISDDIFDKLFDLIQLSDKKRKKQSRKNIETSLITNVKSKKTRKSR